MKMYSTPLFLAVILVSCAQGPVDILVTEDGTVVTGELQTIHSGVAVVSGVEAEVPDVGRIWCNDGSTVAGTIEANEGVFRSGSASISKDRVYCVVWGSTELRQDTFEVDAALGWVNTGIVLEQGQMLSLQSTGTVVTETGVSTPGGQEKFSSSVSLVPAATSGQLVFQTGESSQPMAAGSTWVGESSGSGVLLLAVNVPVEGSMESRGVYTVTVRAGTAGREPGTVFFRSAGR